MSCCSEQAGIRDSRFGIRSGRACSASLYPISNLQSPIPAHDVGQG